MKANHTTMGKFLNRLANKDQALLVFLAYECQGQQQVDVWDENDEYQGTEEIWKFTPEELLQIDTLTEDLHHQICQFLFHCEIWPFDSQQQPTKLTKPICNLLDYFTDNREYLLSLEGEGSSQID